MKISMDLIAKELEPMIVTRQFRGGDELTLERMEFLEAGSQPKERNILYLCDFGDLPPPANLPAGISVLCFNTVGMVDIRKYSHFDFLGLGKSDLRKCANQLLMVFRKYAALRERMEHLQRTASTLQEFIDLGTEIAGLPLCILDRNYKPLAITAGVDLPDDGLWAAFREGYGYKHHVNLNNANLKLKDIFKEGIIETLAQPGNRYVRVSAIFDRSRPVAVLGAHKIEQPEEPFEPHTRQLLSFIVDSVSQWLNSRESMRVGRGRIYESFLLDILEGKITDSDLIESRARQLGFEPNHNYQLGLVAFVDDGVDTDFHALMDHIEGVIPQARCAMHAPSVYVLFTLGRGMRLPENSHRQLVQVMGAHDALCMLNTAFGSLVDARAMRAQVCFMTRHLCDSKACGNVYHYHDFFMQHGISNFAEKIPPHTICHPMLQRIIRYDTENNGDYYKTLKTYLRNNCNVSKTSKLMHLHRNSVIYRINKITTLLDNDLDSWEIRRQLLFSMECLDYSEASLPASCRVDASGACEDC